MPPLQPHDLGLAAAQDAWIAEAKKPDNKRGNPLDAAIRAYLSARKRAQHEQAGPSQYICLREADHTYVRHPALFIAAKEAKRLSRVTGAPILVLKVKKEVFPKVEAANVEVAA